ncbi:hypothetical protein [Paenibacillus sp. ISL-20]|uniref:hypothetical protein n=1 Tax=Paenibacillus sp. ISL-20 TaxID=2819163 RepID=UPI0020363C29|nr:hypothetical protein [Paenibacillus sp. ISL-20]
MMRNTGMNRGLIKPILVILTLLLLMSTWVRSDYANAESPVISDGEPIPNPSDPLIACSTTSCLQSALKNVVPGKRIVLAPGTYTGSFSTDVEGTALQPIVIESQNPAEPAIISGYSAGSGYSLRVRGDYWIIAI